MMEKLILYFCDRKT